MGEQLGADAICRGKIPVLPSNVVLFNGLSNGGVVPGSWGILHDGAVFQTSTLSNSTKLRQCPSRPLMH